MDRRTRRSRKAIFDAFEQLLSEKSYGSITASEIIERADIGRTTFYAHFETKDALLTELCRDLFAHVLKPSDVAEKSHAFDDAASLDERLTHILYHLEDQHARLKSLFEGPSCHLFWQAFEGELATFFSSRTARDRGLSGEIPHDLQTRFLTATFAEACRWWFAHDVQCAPEEVVSYFNRLVG